MRYFIFIFIFITYINVSFPFSSRAQTAVPSKSLDENIENLRENIQEKVKEKLSEITDNEKPHPKKAYVGTITDINETELKIKNGENNYEFTIAEDATFANLKLAKIKLSDLKIGQNVLVLSLNKDTLIYAKRIIQVDPEKLENKRLTISGTIADISTTDSVFTFIPANNGGKEMQMKYSDKTEIRSRENKVIKFSDLKKGQKIISVCNQAQNQSYSTLRLISL